MNTTQVSPAELERCAHACHECQDVCLATLTHCLRRGGRHAEFEHIRMMLDCIDICTSTHALLHRHSHLHEQACRLCAVACVHCGEDCERIADDPRMQRCVEACYRCADVCERMAA